MSIPYSWPVEAIGDAVVPWLPDFSVEVLPEVDSTNSELMRRARAGQVRSILLVAERQTAGRGRLGRSWHSIGGGGQTPQSQSLTFSLGLPLRPRDWSGLSLAVGLSLAQNLDPQLKWGLKLKWPNDLWLQRASQDHKLGGILIETAYTAGLEAAQRYVVIGVGINLDPCEVGGLRTPSAAWRQLEPEATTGEVLQRVAVPLVQAVQQFEAHGFAPLQLQFAQRDALKGRIVQLSQAANMMMDGVAQGVDARGALLVETAEGVQSVSSSEVSVRPLKI